tara:strand:- start:127 stop:2040 length:1914 start_codon:yes stop_codon:yes gene_type:complete
MAGIAILRKLLLKEAAKGSGQASGILSIGDSVRKIADNKLQSYLLSAQKQGVDIDKMGENEIKYMLEMNKPKNKMKVVSQDDPEFKDIMDAMMGKKKDNVIEGKFGKSFAEEVRDKDTKEFKVSREEFDPLRNYDDKVAEDMFQGGPTANDPKIDAEMLAEFLAEDAGKVYDDLPTKERLDFYDRAYKAIIRYQRDNTDFADGGRTGFFMGSKSPKGAALFRELLKFMNTRGGDKAKTSPLELLKRFNPKQYKKLLEDPLLYTKGREGIMASDAIKKGADEAREARIGMTDQLLNIAKKLRKSDKNIEARNKDMIQAAIEAGVSPDLAEDYVRGLTQSMLKATKMDAPKPSDEGILQLEQILKNLKTEGKTKRDLNADGGRIGFKSGMTRRQFLQLVGGLGAAGAAAKTGILKLFGKDAAKKATQQIVKTPPVAGKPEWFDALVNKVILEGDDVTKQFATKEREIVHRVNLEDTADKTKKFETYDDSVYVYRNLDSGEIRVEYNSVDNMSEAPVNLTFKPGIADETTKGKPADEFIADEVVPESRASGPDDYDIEDGIDEFNNVDDLSSDVSRLKEFATNKKGTMKEILDAIKKRKRSRAIIEDSSAQADFITTRQGDYVPEPDDYASGGIAKMLGE